MEKMKALTLMFLLSSLLVFAAPLMAGTASNDDATTTKGEQCKLIKSELGTSVLNGKVQVDPKGWYEFEDISGTLDPDYYDPYGPKEPYSVSVSISSVTPSGYKVTVNIQVNGVSKWSGDLGVGQSSPTITCSGGTTYVRVINNNAITVSYSGRISWYFN